MKIAITGAGGIVGRFVTQAALAAGHTVTTLGRAPLAPDRPGLHFQPWTLGNTPDLAGQDALVHAAFQHKPGRYRGGEGDDPAGFRRANIDGSLRLAEAAAAQHVRRMVFLSSRAVFDGHPPGTLLTEDLPVAPDSLYGEVKVAVEQALAAMAGPGFRPVSLRATGVYGQAPGGGDNKWTPLFAAFLRGEPVPSRVATEVHGADLARAVLMLLAALGPDRDGYRGAGPAAGPSSMDDLPPMQDVASAAEAPVQTKQTWEGTARTDLPLQPIVAATGLPAAVHVSDLVLDHHDLLRRVARVTGRADPPNLPPPSPAESLSVLDCPTLHRLGWTGGGTQLLDETLRAMLAPVADAAGRAG